MQNWNRKVPPFSCIEPTHVQQGNDAVKIYYQKPTFVLKNSARAIFDDYELGVNLRRPDILIHFETRNKLLLIEVKRSSDKRYIADGAYKVLGYLADFEKNFSDKQQKPKAVLVVWNVIRIQKSRHELEILGYDSLEDGMKEIISSIQSTTSV